MSRNCLTLTSCLSRLAGQEGGKEGEHARSGMSQTSVSSMQIRTHKLLCTYLLTARKSHWGANRLSCIALVPALADHLLLIAVRI